MNSLAILLALAAAISWALTQTIAKIGLKRMDLVPYLFIRPLLALPFIVPYGLLTSGFHLPSPGLIGIAILGGLTDSFAGSMLYMFAIRKSSAHKAASLANTAPFWGVVAAVLFLGERAQLTTFIAGASVALGAYFLVTRRGTTSASYSFWEPLPALGAGILWGLAETVPAKYCLTHGMTPITFQLILVCTAAVSWGSVAILRRKKHHLHFPWPGVRVALFTSFTGFFLGWILWLSGLNLALACQLAPVRGGAMTLFAFIFSMLLLHERPSAYSIIGMLLTVAGVSLISIMG